MAYLSMLAILAALGVATAAVGVLLMAYGLLHPPRMTDGKAVWVLKRLSPADLGMLFQEETFQVIDSASGQKVKLAAWWIPAAAPSSRTAIFLHGYADAKVGAIAWAPLWHSLGINILALDLRAHGESQGRHCTGGFHEQHDLKQVIDQLRGRRPAATRELYLFGPSFGGAVALAAASDRDDLAGLVLDSVYADYRRAALAQFDRVGAAAGVFATAAVRLTEWWCEANFSQVRPVDLISRVRCPILMIQSAIEPTISDADVRGLQEALMSHQTRFPADRYWLAVGAEHLMALPQDPALYRRELANFLLATGQRDAQPLSAAQVSTR